MNKNVPYIAAILVAVLISAVFAQELTISGRADLRDRFVLTKTEAVGLMPADLVAGPDVKRIFWSPLGRYLLVEQLVGRSNTPGPADERRLLVYDRKTRISDVLWRYSAERGSLGEVEWLAGTDIALVTVNELPVPTPGDMDPKMHVKLLRTLAPSSSARPVFGAEPPDWINVHVSPSKPFAVAERIAFSQKPEAAQSPGKVATRRSVFNVLKENGAVGPPIELEAATRVRVLWTDAGIPLLHALQPDADGKAQNAAYTIDPVSGRATKMAEAPPLASFYTPKKPAPERPELSVRGTTSTITEGGISRRVRPVWLESSEPSEQSRALVSSNGGWSEISPKGDAVAYLANRSAWVAPLVRLSLSAFDALNKKAVLSDAKMVGLAVRMYTQDYDEKFPLSEHFSGGAVFPYIKDSGVAEGFNYQYPGEGLKDIQKPSEMSMGYISGPGGRAVVYVDGHVKWVPDQK